MQDLLLFLELFHCALNAFFEVKLELSPLESSTIIIVDGAEDVLALGIIHWYFHLPEHLLEFLQLNIEAMILIDLPEQSSERDVCFLQSNVNLVEHALLHLKNSFAELCLCQRRARESARGSRLAAGRPYRSLLALSESLLPHPEVLQRERAPDGQDVRRRPRRAAQQLRCKHRQSLRPTTLQAISRTLIRRAFP